ncbi:hypothetical protein PYW07_015053 [Mythimna separata]|uniref:Uncharacterized protein n=1 Tax=Mythimna separata TaxID=271217 RepID=A0AAD8DZ49_MYTSE|nr:hypothetical protein PYW07_015053 [Mythimna separata]
MGAGQSVRTSAFQRPKAAAKESFIDDEPVDHHISISNKMVERLVEDATLAGGAAAASSQAKLPTPRGDYRDKIYMEKLKCMDESHSEITGLALCRRLSLGADGSTNFCHAARRPTSLSTLRKSWTFYYTCQAPASLEALVQLGRITVNDLSAIAARIDMRTSKMVSVDPICGDCKQKVIQCYDEAQYGSDIIKCWDTVGDFTKCVQEAATTRLRARTMRDARERARRTRHVAHAREHALRDLSSN